MKREDSRGKLIRTVSRKEKSLQRNHIRGDKGRKVEKEQVRQISNLSDLLTGLSALTQIFLKMPANH